MRRADAARAVGAGRSARRQPGEPEPGQPALAPRRLSAGGAPLPRGRGAVRPRGRPRAFGDGRHRPGRCADVAGRLRRGAAHLRPRAHARRRPTAFRCCRPWSTNRWRCSSWCAATTARRWPVRGAHAAATNGWPCRSSWPMPRSSWPTPISSCACCPRRWRCSTRRWTGSRPWTCPTTRPGRWRSAAARWPCWPSRRLRPIRSCAPPALFAAQGNGVGEAAVTLARAELALADGDADRAELLARQAARGFHAQQAGRRLGARRVCLCARAAAPRQRVAGARALRRDARARAPAAVAAGAGALPDRPGLRGPGPA